YFACGSAQERESPGSPLRKKRPCGARSSVCHTPEPLSTESRLRVAAANRGESKRKSLTADVADLRGWVKSRPSQKAAVLDSVRSTKRTHGWRGKPTDMKDADADRAGRPIRGIAALSVGNIPLPSARIPNCRIGGPTTHRPQHPVSAARC